MEITLKELRKVAEIEKVIVHSLDLSLYLVSVLIDGEEKYLVSSGRNLVKSHNKLELQSLFEGISVKKMVLRQETAYDEMIGLGQAGNNTLEVPLGGAKLGA